MATLSIPEGFGKPVHEAPPPTLDEERWLHLGLNGLQYGEGLPLAAVPEGCMPWASGIVEDIIAAHSCLACLARLVVHPHPDRLNLDATSENVQYWRSLHPDSGIVSDAILELWDWVSLTQPTTAELQEWASETGQRLNLAWSGVVDEYREALARVRPAHADKFIEAVAQGVADLRTFANNLRLFGMDQQARAQDDLLDSWGSWTRADFYRLTNFQR